LHKPQRALGSTETRYFTCVPIFWTKSRSQEQQQLRWWGLEQREGGEEDQSFMHWPFALLMGNGKCAGWRSTCLKIENGGGEGNTVAIVHVVRGQATIQSNRKPAKQQQNQNKYQKKKNRKQKKTGEYQKREKNRNNNSKKCDTSYVSIWRVNKIMIQRRKKI